MNRRACALLPALPEGVAGVAGPPHSRPFPARRWGKALLPSQALPGAAAPSETPGTACTARGWAIPVGNERDRGMLLHHGVSELPGAAFILWKVVQAPALDLQ